MKAGALAGPGKSCQKGNFINLTKNVLKTLTFKQNLLESKRIQKNRGECMSKTVTLRLKDDVYKAFLEAARAENRSLANLIETAAFNKIREQQFADDTEMAELLSNHALMQRIKQGSQEAKIRKGRFVE
jgi:hypothetical protein